MRRYARLAMTGLLMGLTIVGVGCDDSETLPSLTTHLLTVTTDGSGDGVVSSEPAGITCGDNCSAEFPADTAVTLTADPMAGSTFVGWEGSGCTGDGPCTVTITEPMTVTATFASANAAIRLRQLGTFATGIFDEGAAEIAAYDPDTYRLFVVNGNDGAIDVIDAGDPEAPVRRFQIDITPYGDGVNSVAFQNGILAAAVEADPPQAPGSVVFFDADGTHLNTVTAGPLPDMVTFTPDGTRVLVANEGEPNDDYTNDPEGSVTIVDISNGVADATATTVGFTAYNSQADALRADGVRIFGPGATVAQDLEPEYIAVSEDGRTAWVVLQENNAIAAIDLADASVTGLWPLGFKDHLAPGNAMDASNRDDGIHFANWPVFGMYQPDGMAAFTVGGTQYLITANEGDGRDYDGFSEEARIADLTLDPTAFPTAATLQEDANLGRLKTTTTLGDTDGDGDFDALYAYGGRSFSLWRPTADGIIQVYDSGDDLERIVAGTMPELFNASNDDHEADARSDDKGPEPEGVTVGTVDGRTYAFIGLERVGGIMVYDVSEPAAPVFIQYVNNRNPDADPTSAAAGDLGPEGLLFIPPESSPTGEPLLAVTSEVSGTTTLYAVEAVEKAFTLQILHSSDNESSFQDPNTLETKILGYATVAEGLREVAADEGVPSIHVTAGDHTLPGPFYEAAAEVPSMGAPGFGDIAIYNAMSLAANGIGNHEFDGGIGDFARMLAAAEYPFIAVNLDFSNVQVPADAPPIQIGANGGSVTANAGKVVKSAYVMADGERIGLIGRAPADFFNVIKDPDTTLPGLDFVGGRDPETGQPLVSAVDGVLEQVDLLEAQGIDKIILLDHAQDFTSDPLSASRLRGIDVIVAAGSTGFMGQPEADGPYNLLREGDTPQADYPTLRSDLDGNPVLVVNSDQQFTYVGNLMVSFDTDGHILCVDPRSGPVATNDAAIAALEAEVGHGLNPPAGVTEAFEALNETDMIVEQFEVVGTTGTALNGNRADVRSRETNLGRLAADSTLWYARNAFPDLGVDAALKNGGGIRDTILGPNITRLSIGAALAFDNQLAVVELSAAELLAVMENAVSRVPALDGRFPQVAGIDLEYDPDREGISDGIRMETPSRVRNLLVTRADGTIDTVVSEYRFMGDPERTFHLATNDFLLTGGDGYAALSAAADRRGSQQPELGERRILADYIQGPLAGRVSLNDPPENPRVEQTDAPAPYTMPTFVVFSDPHLYNADLGTTGAAFESYLQQDRKLLRESEAILDAAIDAVQNEAGIDFVLVPGDLTKDGERAGHEAVADALARLEADGIRAYVVPGNHDINNPHAYAYTGDTPVAAETVTPAEFAEIYSRYGYAEAIDQDPDSLSYVAEPVPGVWLLALDSCRYAENAAAGKPVTGGRFSAATLTWIQETIQTAKSRNKQIIAMAHHGLLEHFTGQSMANPGAEYVIEDWETVSRSLADAGLRLVFTGHYHAQDITRKTWTRDDGTTYSLTDVETGSLVTYPSPYRVVSLTTAGTAEIVSDRITEIDYDTGDLTFPDYALAYLTEGLHGIAVAMLTTPADQGGYGLSAEAAEAIAPQIVDAYVAHYAGDESPDAETQAAIPAYLQSDDPVTRTLGQTLGALWTDLPPADNFATIDLD